jgi:hypothetical protein
MPGATSSQEKRVFEYRAIWNVQGGGTGYSVFHVREASTSGVAAAAQTFAADLRTGFQSIVAHLPDDVILNFDSEARELDVATGQLLAVHAFTAPTAVTGSSTAAYSAPSGARVDLVTAGIVAGRRIRGRTYLVPITSLDYTTTGTIQSTARTAFNACFDTFKGRSGVYSLGVWSRTHGVIADVVTCSTPSEAAILRSRRE